MNLKGLKRKVQYRKNRYLIYFVLILILFCIGVGYASLHTSLSINGVSNVSRATWDIHLDSSSIQVDSGSVTPISAPSVSGTTVSFSARLENQGDYYSYTVDVVNNGTIDAALGSFTLTPTLTNDQSKYLTFTVTYDDGTPLTVGDTLDAHDSRTLKVLARYNSGLDVDDYPIIDEAYDFSLSLNYSQ